jgi:hypothetical protein
MAVMPARPPSFRFADACRTLTLAARRCGLSAPSFRSPPGIDGEVRTIRRREEGAAVVSVAHRDRPFAAVVADLVEGVVVANCLTGADALRVRSALWEAMEAVMTGSEAA